MTKTIFEMYLFEREQWPSEVLQKHQSLVINSFIFIHFVRGEIDNNMHSVHCGFHTKRCRWDTLSFFQKRRFQGFISEILRVINLLREKLFLKSLETTEPFRIFRLFIYIHVVLPVNFPEQFGVCFYFKYLRSYKDLIIQVTKVLKQTLVMMGSFKHSRFEWTCCTGQSLITV